MPQAKLVLKNRIGVCGGHTSSCVDVQPLCGNIRSTGVARRSPRAMVTRSEQRPQPSGSVGVVWQTNEGALQGALCLVAGIEARRAAEVVNVPVDRSRTIGENRHQIDRIDETER